MTQKTKMCDIMALALKKEKGGDEELIVDVHRYGLKETHSSLADLTS